MNETLKSIYDRRSIRKYKPELPKKEEIETVINAAFEAPSAKNAQPWHITVCTNRAVNEEVVEAVRKYHRDNGSFTDMMKDYDNFYGAPCVVYVLANSGNMRYAANDCGNLATTLSLAAHATGLGTCIIWNALPAFNTCRKIELYKKLGIPVGYEPYTMISLGYPDENPPAKPRDKSKINWVE